MQVKPYEHPIMIVSDGDGCNFGNHFKTPNSSWWSYLLGTCVGTLCEEQTNRQNLFTDIDFSLFMCFSIIVSSSCSRYTCAQGMKKQFDYDPLIQQ